MCQTNRDSGKFSRNLTQKRRKIFRFFGGLEKSGSMANVISNLHFTWIEAALWFLFAKNVKLWA